MSLRLCIVVSLTLIGSAPLCGQTPGAQPLAIEVPVGPARTVVSAADVVHAAPMSIMLAQPAAQPGVVALRGWAGFWGAVLGMLAFGLAGAGLGSGSGGEDPGLDEAVHGAAFGSVVGAAFGAALPPGTSTCTFGRRMGVALIGSSAGGLVGYPLGNDSPNILITVPVGAIIGGVIGAERCRTKTGPTQR